MATVLSLLMLLLIALLLGAGWLWWRNGLTKQVGLMLLLAVVVAANIAIWTVPDESGRSMIGDAPAAGPG